MKKIFVTGGAGFIGSHCVVSLVKNGYTPIIIDNFFNTNKNVIKNLKTITKKKIIFYQVDLRDKNKLNLIFKKHKCYSVIHFAGYKAVGESVQKPIYYFENNIVSTLSLLDCMYKNNIFKIIFSSSCTVYDDTQTLPWKEHTKVGNTKNPYGTSKYIIERILMDLVKFDKKWNVSIARYFNAIGNHTSGLIKENTTGIPNFLIPYIIKVVQKKLPYLKVFGKNYKTKDGTCVRDFIHVMDVADGHVALLKNISLKKGLKVYNFGTGKGSSVLDVIKSFEKHTGKSVKYKFTKRRIGDVEASFCSPKKALNDLNWKIRYDLNQAMRDIKKII